MTDLPLDAPAVKKLRDAFGERLKVDDGTGKTFKNCILARFEDGPIDASGKRAKRLRVQAIGSRGKAIEFPKADQTKLRSTFPELAPQLGASGETSRRAQSLKSIVGSVESKEHMHAIESLDANTPEVDLDGFDPKEPKKTLPTAMTWIDASDPEKPVRKILLIEHDVGNVPGSGTKKNRPDHVVVSYELGEAEINQLRQPDGSYRAGFADLNPPPELRKLKVQLSDPNRHISPGGAVRHFKKSIETALATVDWLHRQFRVRVIGTAHLIMMDTLQNPSEVRVGPGGEAKLAKRAPEGKEKHQKTRAEAKVSVDYDDNGRRIGYELHKSRLTQRLRAFKPEHLQKIQDKLQGLHRKVSLVAKSLADVPAAKRTRRR